MATETEYAETTEHLKHLVIGPYPPPYGGISSHIEELGHHSKTLGGSLSVLQFVSGPSFDKHPSTEAVVHGRSSKNVGALTRTLLRHPGRVLRMIGLLAKMGWESPRDHLSGMLKALTISDIIHTDDNNVVSLYGTGEGVSIPYLRSLHPDIPILYWVFAAPHIDIKRFDNVRRLFGTAVKESDVLAASSNYCAGAVELLSPEHNREIRVVYFGVDSDRFPSKLDKTEARRQLDMDIESEGKIVMFLGRMEPEMGISSALEIAERITSTQENVTFLICGARGSLTERAINTADQSNGRIKTIVNVPFDDLPVLYAASDLVIAPTVGAHACMGVTVKEAMAAGRPVVVSDSGGLPEAVVDGKYGSVVALDANGDVNVDNFSTAISSMIASETTLEAMGKASRQTFEDMFTSEDMILKIKSAIKDAVVSRARVIR